MAKEELAKELRSYFTYLGITAEEVLGEKEPIEQAHALQEFMDIVEDDKFEVRGYFQDIPEIWLEVELHEDIKAEVVKLLQLYVIDKAVEVLANKVTEKW